MKRRGRASWTWQSHAARLAQRLVLALSAALWGGVACGGSKKQAETAPRELGAQLPAHDRSSCEFAGRGDREVIETSAYGARHNNIRRVYGLIGQGESFKRVLLCREVDTNLDGYKDVVRTYSEEGEKLREFADVDYDGRIDTWITFVNGRIGQVEVDKNGNGKADETRFYVRGRLSRAQRDTNGDGKADVWEIYDDGRLQRMGVDLDHDGRVDRWDRDEVAAASTQDEEAEPESSETRGGSGDQGENKSSPVDRGAAEKRDSQAGAR